MQMFFTCQSTANQTKTKVGYTQSNRATKTEVVRAAVISQLFRTIAT